MNSKKVMIRAVLLTALMQSMDAQGRQPTEVELKLLNELDTDLAILQASGEQVLDQSIDVALVDLLAVIDAIPEDL